jgi:hypothetical protein
MFKFTFVNISKLFGFEKLFNFEKKYSKFTKKQKEKIDETELFEKS